MCGIAGVLSRKWGPEHDRGLEAMTAALSHRGPDGAGIEVRTAGRWKVGLAHTRLSILDLSDAGRQPMTDDQGSCWLTYNGEVYNFEALRQRLVDLGCTFHSGTDTEVVLQAYKKWGIRAMERFRGMFAFGIWDDLEQTLFLARDQMGIKPLYFYQEAGMLVFASEIRALLASGLVPRKLSREAVASYFSYGSVEAPLTMLEGVQSLEPGQWLSVQIQNGDLRTRLERSSEEAFAMAGEAQQIKQADAPAFLREVLQESVKLHMISDVPLGAFLSGGIDSSALVALMSRVSNQQIRTFSISFSEREYSENHYAELVARKFETAHQDIRLTESGLFHMLPGALQAMDQPSIDGMNTYVIAKAVKEAGITVAISGLGGDELFAGYPSFRRARSMSLLGRTPSAIRQFAAQTGRRFLNGTVYQRKLWDLMESRGNARDVCSISRQLFRPQEVRTLLPDFATQPRGKDFDPSYDVINAVSVCEMRGYMANTLLRDTDFMSMAHALEIRVPMVDPVVVSYILKMPGKWKIESKRPKPLLIDALGDLLPEAVWKRRKMGFTLPFARWMTSTLRPQVENALSDRSGLESLGLDAQPAIDAWKTFTKEPASERWSRPWSVFVLRDWCAMNRVTA